MINPKVALLVAFLGLNTAPAFAQENEGVPLPVVGAGVPALVAVAAAYLVYRGKHRRK
jgi:hypothetical protein